MNNSQQSGRRSAGAARTTERSRTRRAELIATGRELFSHQSYDALSMDEISQRAGVAKGLIYYYFTNKRGYYLAVIEHAVDELVARATGGTDLPRTTRVHRTLDGYLRYAQHNRAAYRTIVTGGVGHDVEVVAIRDKVRREMLTAIARGAWGSPDIPPTARLALTGWLSAVEGVTLDWLDHDEDVPRDTVRALLGHTLRDTLHTVETFEPRYPAPPESFGA
ncbi:TetR/AcrR family transcriptional regulator [Streptomyces sp. HNM0574]|uniref:TetR/AcrR family transcriptional regulator n=1 Tax=Streptomyces sp. HNM0574 TaxID=2714954 RepID=UPI00146D99DE|nr:TetR/AcrR family transcriptional regulator [Streptomyces sp. HNM0574]NLU68448.1 TetR/AcrR family transcriptional regulator [Streptomyces sp. HNM0574]